MWKMKLIVLSCCGLMARGDFSHRRLTENGVLEVEEVEDLHPLQRESHGASIIDGFVLESVYRVGMSPQRKRKLSRRGTEKDKTVYEPVLIRHVMNGAVLRRRLEDTDNVEQTIEVSLNTTRDKVRTFAKMNRALYPPASISLSAKLLEIFQSGSNLYGGEGATAIEAAVDEETKLNAWRSEMLDFLSTDDSWQERFHPEEGIDEGMGVAMGVYRSVSETVLVFRGSYTTGDVNNMFLWFDGWIFERFGPQLVENWKFATNTDLTTEMEQRLEVDDLSIRGTFMASVNLFRIQHDELWMKIAERKGSNINATELIVNGYWPLTKQVVREVLPENRTLDNEDPVYITGYSQGGGRASLVSMWLEQTDGIAYETYVFGAVGVQCAVRYALSEAYAEDVDVSKLHPQITQYVHALDAYGNMDYQVGNVCKYGVTHLRDFANPSGVRDFCARSIGRSGPQLLSPSSEYEKHASMCRYFTHWVESVTYWLGQDDLLDEDGVTDGGCSLAEIIPKDDPDRKCPPCRDERCPEDHRLPETALNWQNQMIVYGNRLLDHPCIDEEEDEEVPTVPFTTKQLPEGLSQNGRFQSCAFLGGSASDDFLLSGAQSIAKSNVTEQAEVYNVAFRKRITQYSSIEMQGSLWFKTMGNAFNESAEPAQHVVMQYTLGKNSVPRTLFDINLGRNEQKCEDVCEDFTCMFSVCVSSVDPAGSSRVRRHLGGEQSQLETYLSIGLASVIDQMGTFDATAGLAVKIGEFRPANGSISLMDNIQFLNRESSVLIEQMKDLKTAGEFAMMQYRNEPVSSDHTCFSGVAPVTEEMKRRFSIIPNEDMNSQCLILGEDVSVKITNIRPEDPTGLNYTLAAAETCFDTIIDRVESAFGGSIALDTATIEQKLKTMLLFDIPKLQGTINTLTADDFDLAAWVERVKGCLSENEMLSDFVCHAIDKPALWPSVEQYSEAELNRQIRDSIHYAVVLDYVTQAISDDGDGRSLLTDVYNAQTLNRPEGFWNVLTPFEVAKVVSMQAAIEAWLPVPDWNEPENRWNIECCKYVGQAGLRINVLEAVLEDYRQGYPQNADAGLAMVLIPNSKMQVDETHKKLYETWNLAFVSHYDESPYFYAKLVNPAVTCSDPKRYIFHRAIALYMHIHAEVFSRVHRQNATSDGVIYEAMDWKNRELTQVFGQVNKKHADPWLFEHSFDQQLVQSKGGLLNAMRLDVVVKIGDGMIISMTLVGSLVTGPTGLMIELSSDLGQDIQTIPLQAVGASCVNSGGAGDLDVCFQSEDDSSTSGRRKLQESGESEDDDGVDYLTIFAFVKWIGTVGVMQTPGMTTWKLPVPPIYGFHECFGATYITSDWRQFFVSEYNNTATVQSSCTFLGPQSLLSLNSYCENPETCNISLKLKIGSGMFSEEQLPRSLMSSHEDFLQGLDLDEHSIDEVFTRYLTSSPEETQVVELDLVKSGHSLINDIRVMLSINAHKLFDVDLLASTIQCLSSPVLEICIERSFEGVELPDGWFKNDNFTSVTNDNTTVATRRLTLENEESIVGLTLNILGQKRTLPLAVINQAENTMSILSGSWQQMQSNEGFNATTAAPTHDACRDVECGEGFVCAQGAEGQDPCFPSLFESPQGESKTLLQQVVRLAKNPYQDVAAEYYQEDGWNVTDRICVQHSSEIIHIGEQNLATRTDCAIVAKKEFVGGIQLDVPWCSIAFEGSDDSFEALEPAFKLGFVLLNGYYVWRGLAREYRRFKFDPEFQTRWVTMMQNSTECSQIYITGHSMGASVAAMHRIDYEIGRLVIFASPAIFMPYSYPSFCMGESFHLAKDAVKAYPIGFTLNGVRQYSFCTDDGIVEDHGCFGSFLGERDYCHMNDNHLVVHYRSFIDDLKDGETEFGTCTPPTFPGEWIQKCVVEKCSEYHADCAMGPEALRAKLTYDHLKIEVVDKVKNMVAPGLGRASEVIGFNVPNVRDAQMALANQQLCNANSTDPDYDDNSSDAMQSRATTQTCVILDPTTFVMIYGQPQADPNVALLEASVYTNVFADAILASPAVSITVHTALLPIAGNVTDRIAVQIYPSNLPWLRSKYKIEPMEFLCHGMESVKICLVYKEVDEENGTLEVNFFPMEDLSYHTSYATVSAGETNRSIVIAQDLSMNPQYGNVQQLFLEQGLLEAPPREAIGSGQYCAKIITDAFCDFTGGGGCDKFRNANCMTGGICGCGEGLCASQQGICIPQSSAGALQSIGHPCVTGEGMLKLFEVIQDPSYGVPYERCVAFGQNSYMRLDFPTPGEANNTAVTGVNAIFKIGFGPTIPLSFERKISSLIGLTNSNVTDLNAPPDLLDIKITQGKLLHDDDGDFSDEVMDVILQTVMKIDEEGEACEVLATTSSLEDMYQGFPIADLCVRITPIPENERRMEEVENSENGEIVESQAQLAVSLCIPALFDGCHIMPIAIVKRRAQLVEVADETDDEESEGGNQTSGVIRRLKQVVKNTYEVVANSPDDGFELEQTERQSEEEKVPWYLSVTMIIFYVIITLIFIFTLLNLCMATILNEDEEDLAEKELETEMDELKPTRASSVHLARKRNFKLFQRASNDPYNVPLRCSTWIPQKHWLRYTLCNQWPMHFARVFFRCNVDLINVPLFPDEKTKVQHQGLPTLIQLFLVWRRSQLHVFSLLAVVIIAMCMAADGPQVYDHLKGVYEGKVVQEIDHEEVRAVMKFMKAIVSDERAQTKDRMEFDVDMFKFWNWGDDDTKEDGDNDDASRRVLSDFSRHIVSNAGIGVRGFEDQYSSVKEAVYRKHEKLRKLAEREQRLLQESEEESSEVDTTTGSTTNGEESPILTFFPEDYNLEQAFEIRGRLRTFDSIMWCVKMFLAIFTLFMASRGIRCWHDYKKSSKWIIVGFVLRSVIVIIVSCFPWYYFFFNEDEEERPKSMNTSARMYLMIMINIPVMALSFMLTPGLVGGSLIVMELVPFTIMTYIIIFAVPLIVMITLWPMCSALGHGLGNSWILYGSLLYVGYGLVTTFAAWNALRSMQAFKNLGKQTVIKAAEKRNSFAAGGVSSGSGCDGAVIMEGLGKQSPRNEVLQAAEAAVETLGTRRYRSGYATPPKSSTPPKGESDADNVLANPMLMQKLTTLESTTSSQRRQSQITQSTMASSLDRSNSNNQLAMGKLDTMDTITEEDMRDMKDDADTRPRYIRRQERMRSRMDSMASVSSEVEVVDGMGRKWERRDRRLDSTGSNFGVDRTISSWAEAKLNKSMSSMSLDSLDSQDSIANLDLFGGSFCLGSQNAASQAKKSRRGSMEMAEAVVQATLISHLHTHMLPRMFVYFRIAQALYALGVLMVMYGVYEEGADLMDIMIEHNLVGKIIVFALECLINRLMIEVSSIDVILIGLMKLRLFNGYMADDTVLTKFCVLQGYVEELNKNFSQGAAAQNRRNSRASFSSQPGTDTASRRGSLAEKPVVPTLTKMHSAGDVTDQQTVTKTQSTNGRIENKTHTSPAREMSYAEFQASRKKKPKLDDELPDWAKDEASEKSSELPVVKQNSGGNASFAATVREEQIRKGNSPRGEEFGIGRRNSCMALDDDNESNRSFRNILGSPMPSPVSTPRNSISLPSNTRHNSAIIETAGFAINRRNSQDEMEEGFAINRRSSQNEEEFGINRRSSQTNLQNENDDELHGATSEPSTPRNMSINRRNSQLEQLDLNEEEDDMEETWTSATGFNRALQRKQHENNTSSVLPIKTDTEERTPVALQTPATTAHVEDTPSSSGARELEGKKKWTGRGKRRHTTEVHGPKLDELDSLGVSKSQEESSPSSSSVKTKLSGVQTKSKLSERSKSKGSEFSFAAQSDESFDPKGPSKKHMTSPMSLSSHESKSTQPIEEEVVVDSVPTKAIPVAKSESLPMMVTPLASEKVVEDCDRELKTLEKLAANELDVLFENIKKSSKKKKGLGLAESLGMNGQERVDKNNSVRSVNSILLMDDDFAAMGLSGDVSGSKRKSV